MAPNELFTNTGKVIPTQMFQCFVSISLNISVFLIKQKLGKHTDSPRSRYQNLGWFWFWNIKIFEGLGCSGLNFAQRGLGAVELGC